MMKKEGGREKEKKERGYGPRRRLVAFVIFWAIGSFIGRRGETGGKKVLKKKEENKR